MADAHTTRATAIKTALEAATEPDQRVQEEIVRAVIGEPDQKTRSVLWVILITGLLLVLGYTVWGMMDLLTDGDPKTSPDKLLIVFTPVLTGLLGLFAPSPIARGNR
jgi:hypothetical protein